MHGEFNELAQTLNSFGQNLHNLVWDSSDVLNEMANDNLTRATNVKGVGDFSKLTDGVEFARLALNEIVCHVKRVSEMVVSTGR
ncbi:MAG: hypothetical protein R2741_11810 [Methanolobus sp.]